VVAAGPALDVGVGLAAGDVGEVVVVLVAVQATSTTTTTSDPRRGRIARHLPC